MKKIIISFLFSVMLILCVSTSIYAKYVSDVSFPKIILDVTPEFYANFDPNGGNLLETTGLIDGTKKVVELGGTYGTMPSADIDNKLFAGWYTSVTGGDKIDNTSVVDITSDITLYAHYSDIITFTKAKFWQGGSSFNVVSRSNNVKRASNEIGILLYAGDSVTIKATSIYDYGYFYMYSPTSSNLDEFDKSGTVSSEAEVGDDLTKVVDSGWKTVNTSDAILSVGRTTYFAINFRRKDNQDLTDEDIETITNMIIITRNQVKEAYVLYDVEYDQINQGTNPSLVSCLDNEFSLSAGLESYLAVEINNEILTAGIDYTYNNDTGKLVINNINGNVVIKSTKLDVSFQVGQYWWDAPVGAIVALANSQKRVANLEMILLLPGDTITVLKSDYFKLYFYACDNYFGNYIVKKKENGIVIRTNYVYEATEPTYVGITFFVPGEPVLTDNDARLAEKIVIVSRIHEQSDYSTTHRLGIENPYDNHTLQWGRRYSLLNNVMIGTYTKARVGSNYIIKLFAGDTVTFTPNENSNSLRMAVMGFTYNGVKYNKKLDTGWINFTTDGWSESNSPYRTGSGSYSVTLTEDLYVVINGTKDEHDFTQEVVDVFNTMYTITRNRPLYDYPTYIDGVNDHW